MKPLRSLLTTLSLSRRAAADKSAGARFSARQKGEMFRSLPPRPRKRQSQASLILPPAVIQLPRPVAAGGEVPRPRRAPLRRAPPRSAAAGSAGSRSDCQRRPRNISASCYITLTPPAARAELLSSPEGHVPGSRAARVFPGGRAELPRPPASPPAPLGTRPAAARPPRPAPLRSETAGRETARSLARSAGKEETAAPVFARSEPVRFVLLLEPDPEK